MSTFDKWASVSLIFGYIVLPSLFRLLLEIRQWQKEKRQKKQAAKEAL